MVTRLLLFNALIMFAAAMSLLFFVDEEDRSVSSKDHNALDHITFTAYPSDL
ncbi:hypothetical protein SAMN02745126_02743 [Enhydrobacter aerosaccus]|uniref:Uncharacterized protein n=1 Tax=Enhydrobacter aerosaccus TaxID=225324 RepID=A0A1T4PCL6_9HYPH|nr:hypothetical protein [Enhydrobacter aerosaccus]SJZ89300.1 hypothetical protein SAMN02745126_02743 [Enhydrobacter aerosaccus]